MSKYKLGDITIKDWNSWDNCPRDPVNIGYMIIQGVGYSAAGTAVAGLTFGATIGYWAVGYLATTLVTGAILSALAPKDTSARTGDSSGLQVNAKSPTAPLEIVYGQIRKGGTITYVETTGGNNKTLHQIIVLAGHEVEEIGDIYINDKIVTLNSSGQVTDDEWKRRSSEDGSPLPDNASPTPTITIYKHDGSQTSVTSAFANVASKSLSNTLLSTSGISADPDTFVGKGLAYIYVQMLYDPSTFANGVPTFTAVVKGKKVVTTSSGVEQTAAWSSNAAWVIRDFLTSSYGLGDTEIDYTTFEAAADVCDETTQLSDGTAQYQINGVVSTGESIGEVLGDMTVACGGTLFWGTGKWKLFAGDFVTPTKTLTMDDFRSGISIDTRASTRDIFNSVSGTFVDKDQDWISVDYPKVKGLSDAYLSEDNNEESTLDLPLRFTTNGKAAQRLARQILNRAREQMTISADFGLNALDIEVGDFIKIDDSMDSQGSGNTKSRYGWGGVNAKTFEVVGWRLNPNPDTGALSVNLTLRESSSAAFGWSAADEQAIVSNNTNLLEYYEVPSVGLTITSSYRQVNENVVSVLNVDVTSGDNERVDSVILKYKEGSGNYISVGQTVLVNEGSTVARFEIVGVNAPAVDDVPSFITYTFHATPVNSFGYKGAPTIETHNLYADDDPPDSPTELNKVLSGGTLFLKWPAVSALDLSHYALYHTSNTSGTFADALIKIDKIARPATSVAVEALQGKFFITAFDKSGNESANPPSVTVLSTELPALGFTTETDEHTAFSGTGITETTGVSVVSSGLELTSYSSQPSSGTYYFWHEDTTNHYIDIGLTPRTLRLGYDLTSSRKHANAVSGEVNWDDIPGNFDTWPGNFDTWTDEDADFGDYNVTVQARVADTSSGLSSASWQDAAGEVQGQFVQFRANLSSSSDNVTPRITALTARVEY